MKTKKPPSPIEELFTTWWDITRKSTLTTKNNKKFQVTIENLNKKPEIIRKEYISLSNPTENETIIIKCLQKIPEKRVFIQSKETKIRKIATLKYGKTKQYVYLGKKLKEDTQ